MVVTRGEVPGDEAIVNTAVVETRRPVRVDAVAENLEANVMVVVVVDDEEEEEQAEVEAKVDTMADAVLVLLVAMANS